MMMSDNKDFFFIQIMIIRTKYSMFGGGRDTKEVLGRESKSFGRSRRMDFIH